MYSGADRTDYLEKCAKEEGSVTVYDSRNYLWEPLRDGFRKKYPDIKITASRRPSAEVAEALTKEQAAGIHKADVVANKVESTDTLIDLLQPYKSPEQDAYPAEDIGPDSKYTVSDRMPFALAYNTKEVAPEDVPQTSEDLLNPKFKGRIAMITTSPGIQWTGYMQKKYGEDFVKKFGEQDIQTTDTASDQLATQVAAGEYLLAPAINLSGVQAILDADPNATIAWKPVDALWSASTVALLKTAPHPCAAMLYIDYVLSEEGQTVNPLANMSARKGVPLSPDLPKGVEAKDISEIVGSHDGDKYLEQYEQWTDLMDRYIIHR